jgi:DNA-binding transcriptional ArsR family regulator
MKDKELLLKAVEDYPKYKSLRKKILKLIIGCSLNGISTISPSELVKELNITKSTAYSHLKALKKDGIIISPDEGEEQFTTFRLNQMKADDIIAIYSMKKDYLKKI